MGASPRLTLNGKFCIVDYRISSDRAGRRDWDDVGIVPYDLRIYSGTGEARINSELRITHYELPPNNGRLKPYIAHLTKKDRILRSFFCPFSGRQILTFRHN